MGKKERTAGGSASYYAFELWCKYLEPMVPEKCRHYNL